MRRSTGMESGTIIDPVRSDATFVRPATSEQALNVGEWKYRGILSESTSHIHAVVFGLHEREKV